MLIACCQLFLFSRNLLMESNTVITNCNFKLRCNKDRIFLHLSKITRITTIYYRLSSGWSNIVIRAVVTFSLFMCFLTCKDVGACLSRVFLCNIPLNFKPPYRIGWVAHSPYYFFSPQASVRGMLENRRNYQEASHPIQQNVPIVN